MLKQYKYCILTLFRQVLDAEMRKATSDSVGKSAKMAERMEITEEDEQILWEKELLGDHTAKSLMNTMYFYNGKLFGLRSKEQRGLRFCNFRVDLVSITYDETVSKNHHGGLNNIKYSTQVVKHVCCIGKETNHTQCIRKCYAKYLERIKVIARKQEAFYFKSNLNAYEYYNMVVGVNTINQILPEHV